MEFTSLFRCCRDIGSCRRGGNLSFFAGENALEAVRRYNLFCGGGVLPPRWGLGFTQRVHKMYTAGQVEKEADEFEKRQYRWILRIGTGLAKQGISLYVRMG